MPKHLRLSQADFALLRKQKPHRIHGVFFSLTTYTLPSSFKGPRVATVISKKIIPKAVMRNKIERWCREATRLNKKKPQPNFAYVLSPKKDVINSSYKEVEKDIRTLFERTVSRGTIQRT
jgi:ribonuclease P protein component